MTERESMSQEDNKQEIKVNLLLDSGVDYLVFNIPGKIHRLNLNLEDNQIEIKKMFLDLLPLLKVGSVELVIDIQEGYANTLLKEVGTSYIDDLNQELITVRTEFIDDEEEE